MIGGTGMVTSKANDPASQDKAQDTQPSDDAEGWLITAAILGIILFSLAMSWQAMDQWRFLAVPYKYSAAYYHYFIQLPIHSFPAVWEYGKSLTIYPHVNWALAPMCCGIYVVLIWILWIGLPYLVCKTLSMRSVAWILYLGPALLALAWFMGTTVFGWVSAGFAWLFAH